MIELATASGLSIRDVEEMDEQGWATLTEMFMVKSET